MCTEQKRRKICSSFSMPVLASAKSGISQLSGLSHPVQGLGQAFACMASSSHSEDGWAERAQTRAKQGSSWEEDPAVTNLAQCLFLKKQQQGWWCWRSALPLLHLSHLDEVAEPHAGAKIHVIVCNRHWSFKAQAKLPALALLPCSSYFICLFPNSLSPAFKK